MEYTFASRHDNCKNLQSQSSQSFYDNTDLGKALFYAVKSKDWKQAFYLMENDAPISRIYQYNESAYLSTVSVLVQIISEARVKHDHRMLPYKLPDRLLDQFIALEVDLKCHCTPKFAHRCPLFIALKNLKIKSEQEIFLPKNELVRKLIINGATIKQYLNDKRTFNIPWFDVQQVKSYLLSQQSLQKEQKQEKNLKLKNQCKNLIEKDQDVEYNSNIIKNLDEQQQQEQTEEIKKQQTADFNRAVQQASQQNNVQFNVNSNGGTIKTFKKLKSEFHV